METQAILARLEPYHNRVVCTPMSEDDLANLEQHLSTKLPAGLRTFLQHIGFAHNLTTRVPPFLQLFETSKQYVQERDWALSMFGAKSQSMIPFAHDGAGNLYAVNFGHETVMFLDHDVLKISALDFTFNQWLDSVVSQTIESIERRLLN